MKTTETAISAPVLCAMVVPDAKNHNRPPMGSIDARIEATTTPAGMSLSVRATLPPPCLAREAATDSRMPRTIGTMIFTRVHTAATAMTPAPMKRTSERKTAPRASSRPSPPSKEPEAK